jgi:hypothetical protein
MQPHDPLTHRPCTHVMARAIAAVALTACIATADAQDATRIEQMRQDILELQRAVRDQSRRIDALERQLANASVAPPRTGPSSGVPASPAGSDKWLAPANWDRVGVGMTEQQVLDVLGYPTSVRAEPAGTGKTLFYTMQVGATGFLSGRVVLSDQRVSEVQKPVLR